MARPPRLPDATILQLIEELRAQHAVLTGTRLREELQARHGVRGGVTRLYRLLHRATRQPQPAPPRLPPPATASGLPSDVTELQAQLAAALERARLAEYREEAHQAAGPTRSTTARTGPRLTATPHTACACWSRTCSTARASSPPPTCASPNSKPAALARRIGFDDARNLVTIDLSRFRYETSHRASAPSAAARRPARRLDAGSLRAATQRANSLGRL